MSDQDRPIVLIVDDEPDILNSLADLLKDKYEILTANSGQKALEIVQHDARIAAVVMDIKMPDMDGLTATKECHKVRPELPVIILTGYPGDYQQEEIDRLLQPFEYIVKSENPLVVLERALRNAVKQSLLSENIIDPILYAETTFGMVGRSPEMLEIYKRMRKIADSDNVVVVLGESGTGKELVARGIHKISRRHDREFRAFNCNHRNKELIDSELFGHARGAYTDAKEERRGHFECADGGTVFLDEIGDLPHHTQGSILRVLEDGEYTKLGSDVVQHTDIRLISATNKDLQGLVGRGKIREDFFYRIDGARICLPPLRDRRDDIPLLVSKFRDRYCRKTRFKEFDSRAMEIFIGHHWPGNVRQLKKAVEDLIAMTDDGIIGETEVNAYLNRADKKTAATHLSLAERIRQFEIAAIIDTLERCDGNISATARYLKTDRANLSKKIKKYKIDLSGVNLN